MDALSGTAAIEVWEAGRSRHPVDRALALLAACTPGTADELAKLSIGQRDAWLLRMRQAAFGDRLELLARCPDCDEHLAIELACGVLLSDATSETVAREHELVLDGHTITYRMPDSDDLAAIATMTDIEEARRTLLSRCVLTLDGRASNDGGLPETLATAVAAAMAELEPCAEVLLDLDCPQCGHEWQSALDIASVLWAEVAACARRLLFDVDQLARAYGWHESEILALSPGRRARYLEMVAG
jgi:hypothetical protein